MEISVARVKNISQSSENKRKINLFLRRKKTCAKCVVIKNLCADSLREKERERALSLLKDRLSKNLLLLPRRKTFCNIPTREIFSVKRRSRDTYKLYEEATSTESRARDPVSHGTINLRLALLSAVRLGSLLRFYLRLSRNGVARKR